jgi:molybdopterin converting factor small subunit
MAAISAFAVNGYYAKPTTRLADGDEVAFIPPVSGG